MPARYHPLYDGIWNNPKLEGAPFELYGFFIYLFANHRLRPSGIYRVEDAQIAADTHLPIAKVRRYIADLEGRGCILRDGAWMFIHGYFDRQPKQAVLLSGVRTDVQECSSERIRITFQARYTLFAQQFPQLFRPSSNGHPTVARPQNYNDPTEQSSTEQSRAVSDRRSTDGPLAREILDWLNEKTGKNFEPVDSNLNLIKARLGEGRPAWLLKKLVTVKARQWPKGHEMHEYLRPATLFNATKCAQYIGELPRDEEPA